MRARQFRVFCARQGASNGRSWRDRLFVQAGRFRSILGPARAVAGAEKHPCYTGRMRTNILTTALALPDRELLARIDALARTEHETIAELLAHLVALELRPTLYLALGYGSLYRYCTGALRLSEDAACNRIKATRTCRTFPVILGLLASGGVSLTTVRLLGPHLTAENHEAVLARAMNRSREEVEALVAELCPQPDVVSSVRKLPVPKEMESLSAPPTLPFAPVIENDVAASRASFPADPSVGTTELSPDTSRLGPALPAPTARPVVRALSPSRYRVQFTIGRETYDDLRWLQGMLRREIPNGDPAALFGRALRLLREEVEKTKLGKTKSSRHVPKKAPGSSPYPAAAAGAYAVRIRPETDRATGNGRSSCRKEAPSRHIPNAVKRAVWLRDRGQCAFVSGEGRRCSEHTFLELHHIQPYAREGPATAGNIALRCRRHNQYEAEVVFGPRSAAHARDAG
jgi:HNH endonuclease